MRRADILTTLMCRFVEILEPEHLEPQKLVQACGGKALPLPLSLDDDDIFLRNVGTYIPSGAASRARRPESTVIPL
jgi:hypothetical protein